VAPDRLVFVDGLRGFALFGVFWANLQVFAGFGLMTGDERLSRFGGGLDRAAYFLENFFVENKFMGLFSFLFGNSFWLFLSRVQARGAPALRLFHRRVFWLFVIGAIHGWLFWCFDILRFYALWAILLPWFVRVGPKPLLRVALFSSTLMPALVAGIDVAIPAVPVSGGDLDSATLAAFARGGWREVLAANWRYDWFLNLSVSQIAYQVAVFGRLLLGLYVARTMTLDTFHDHRSLLKRIAIAGGLLGAVGSAIFAGGLVEGARSVPWLAFLRRLIVESGQLGLTLAYASALALASTTGPGRRLMGALAPIGQMALTWYLLQTAFGIWLFYGFAPGPRLMGIVGPSTLLVLAVAGFGLQIALARTWMARFRFGPAEWVWRSLTYGEAPPLRRAVDPGP